jgi:hypothetical protein
MVLPFDCDCVTYKLDNRVRIKVKCGGGGGGGGGSSSSSSVGREEIGNIISVLKKIGGKH